MRWVYEWGNYLTMSSDKLEAIKTWNLIYDLPYFMELGFWALTVWFVSSVGDLTTGEVLRSWHL